MVNGLRIGCCQDYIGLLGFLENVQDRGASGWQFSSRECLGIAEGVSKYQHRNSSGITQSYPVKYRLTSEWKRQ